VCPEGERAEKKQKHWKHLSYNHVVGLTLNCHLVQQVAKQARYQTEKQQQNPHTGSYNLLIRRYFVFSLSPKVVAFEHTACVGSKSYRNLSERTVRMNHESIREYSIRAFRFDLLHP
jgi:hypothetical protein